MTKLASVRERNVIAMNAFKKRLLSGERMVGYEVDLCDPCISEMVGQAGFDYIWIDTEHSAMDYQTVLMHIIATKAGGSASIVRVPWNEPYLAKRILEMGPDGIIFPMVNSAEELQDAMDACMYPPYGKRGFGPRRACKYCTEDLTNTYIPEAPDRICRIAQVEHVDAVRNLDAMLKVPFLDAIILGPCDLSGTIGHLNDIFHPEVLALIDECIAKCKAAGIPIGIAVGANTEADVRFWLDRGIQFISAGSDMSAIANGARAQYAMMRRVVDSK